MTVIKPSSDLHKLLNEGIDAMKEKKVRPFSQALLDIQRDYNTDNYEIEITKSTP